MKLLALILLPAFALAQSIPFRPDFPAVDVPGANVTGGRDPDADNYVVDTILTNHTATWVEAVPGGTYPGYIRCNARYFAEVATSPKNAFTGVSGYELVPYGDDIAFDTGDWTWWNQTGPNGGIVFRNDGIAINAGSDNFYLEHHKFITGDSVRSINGTGQRLFNCEADGIQIQVSQSANSDLVGGVVSHCTTLHGIDEGIGVFNNNPDLRKIDSLLFWRNLVGASVDIPTNTEAVDYGYPDNPDITTDGYSDGDCDNHSYGFSIGLSYQAGDNIDPNKGNHDIVLIENMFPHNDARNVLSNCDLTMGNNLIYNADNRGTYFRNEGPSGDPGNAPATTSNLIANYYKAGPVTGGGLAMQPVHFGEGFNNVINPADDDTLVAGSQVFMAGNQDDWSQDEFYVDAVGDRTPHIASTTRNDLSAWGYQFMGAEHLVDYLVPRVGASYRSRTVNEQTILHDVTTGEMTYSSEPLTATLIKSVTNTNMPNAGGFPSIPYTKRIFTDLPADPNGDDDSDGYSNLEEWVFDNHTKYAEYQGKTILHGSWEYERYPWMGDTFTQLERRVSQQ